MQLGLKKPPLNRNVRACLYDGDKFVGNAHIFAAAKAAEEEDEPWVFINKVSQSYTQMKPIRIISSFLSFLLLCGVHLVIRIITK